jgi:hypothetical protein
MSSALARKKRTGEANIPPPVPAPKPSGLTLPQVIAVIDNRLIALETFVKESKGSGNGNAVMKETEIDDSLSNELMTRYEILAQEIAELKDIVLKLQTYTMDVNKTLLEERIHILSDLGNNNQEVSKEDTNLYPLDP